MLLLSRTVVIGYTSFEKVRSLLVIGEERWCHGQVATYKGGDQSCRVFFSLTNPPGAWCCVVAQLPYWEKTGQNLTPAWHGLARQGCTMSSGGIFQPCLMRAPNLRFSANPTRRRDCSHLLYETFYDRTVFSH